MPPNEFTADPNWFEENLQPHEPMLRAWLRSQFSDRNEIDDTIHDAYIRVLQTHAEKPICSPKAFLFATAHNCALMRIRKSKVRREISLADFELSDILVDKENITQAIARSEELEFLTQAIQSLPQRCRQIITLRKIYGISQRAIAKQLDISESTVETQGTIGIKKLSAYFRRHKIDR